MTLSEYVCIRRNRALVLNSVRILEAILRLQNVVIQCLVIEPNEPTGDTFWLAKSVIHIALVEPDGRLLQLVVDSLHFLGRRALFNVIERLV